MTYSRGLARGGLHSKPTENGLGDILKPPHLSPSDVAKEQHEYYKDTFIPIEKKLGGQVRSPKEIEALTKNAGIKAGGTEIKAKEEFKRNIGRQGIQLSEDQKTEFNQLSRRGGIESKAGAMTRVRSGLYDQNIENLGNFVALGRDLATSSQDALADASANRAATQNANKQISAQNKAGIISTVATVGVAVAVF